MRENLITIPFWWSGTTAQGGTIQYTTPVALSFHSGAIWTNADDGGTVLVRYSGTAQGTATLNTDSPKAGTAYSGTAATGAGIMLQIPANGTVIISGTASSATQMSGFVAFYVEEYGGTAWPVTAS